MGRPHPEPSQNPGSGGCLFSTRNSRSEVPERQDFGEENCLGKGGGGQGKKRKKGCAKKGGETKHQMGYRTILGERAANLLCKVAHAMGYSSDSIAISRNTGPLSLGGVLSPCTEKVSRGMGYCSDNMSISREMGPLRL